jgi:hypothetical protein
VSIPIVCGIEPPPGAKPCALALGLQAASTQQRRYCHETPLFVTTGYGGEILNNDTMERRL